MNTDTDLQFHNNNPLEPDDESRTAHSTRSGQCVREQLHITPPAPLGSSSSLDHVGVNKNFIISYVIKGRFNLNDVGRAEQEGSPLFPTSRH
jgi:hypothetical protein